MEPSLSQWVDLIKTVGFPIALSVYLVVWVTKEVGGKFDRMQVSIEKQNELLASIQSSIDRNLNESVVQSVLMMQKSEMGAADHEQVVSRLKQP